MLDQHRRMLLERLEGLDDEQMRRPVGPSQLTMLGMVKHMACVEMGWFQRVFVGGDPDIPATPGDGPSTFTIEQHSTNEIFELYDAACTASRKITSAAQLDEIAQQRVEASLRWILIHMIEETAQHNGHADIMRELIDGKTFTS